MCYRRSELRHSGILTAIELSLLRHGARARTAGCVIARQRPGTAKGMMFISMEDETGISSIIVTPDMFEREKLVVTRSKFLAVEGRLQNDDDVIHVMAERVWPLANKVLELRSHDFH
jgi:error-prone DNA polymerase